MSLENKQVPSQRLALVIEYDGANFHGYQIQKNLRTVQQELEKALAILAKEPIGTIASGRTDTGVHALEQVVHFNWSSEISLKKMCWSLNGILPPDVSVKNIYRVPADFHARFSAQERVYQYLIYNSRSRSPLWQKRALWVKDNLDLDYLREVSAYLVGEMDFASFCKKTSQEESTVRRINRLEITKKKNLINFKIWGTAFLHHMIRIIIGTILMMHEQHKKPEDIKEIINKRDRDMAGPTTGAHGLYLLKVSYDPPLDNWKRAF